MLDKAWILLDTLVRMVIRTRGRAEVNEALLIKKAQEAAEFAYAPYSGFRVGAALLCADGQIYIGCNVENAAYGVSNCAERTAIFKAVSEGVQHFRAIAITGAFANESGDKRRFTMPCGTCLQVMTEFCNPDEFIVFAANPLGELKRYTLRELLPHSFALEG